MTRTLYRAQATVRGGRAEGRGRTTDGALDVQLRSPVDMGGDGGGTNPEQLLAVGWAACFEGALGVVAARDGTELRDVWIDAHVDLLHDGGEEYGLQVALHVQLPRIDDEAAARRLVREAHQICPYSRATRGNITVELTANGLPV